MKSQSKDFFVLKDVAGHLDLSLKQRVRFLLLRIGMSQNKLADEIGISHGTLSKIVNGDWGASSYIKIRMSQVLEVDSLVIFGDKQYFEDYLEKINYGVNKSDE